MRQGSRRRALAFCVERGLTNRQISSQLSISERSVENHVRNLLKKLGFSSRTRIAGWVAQQCSLRKWVRSFSAGDPASHPYQLSARNEYLTYAWC